MATFILATLLFMVLFAAMAVGVIFSNKPIKGSCGGLNNVGLGGECEICGGDRSKCDESAGGGEVDKSAMSVVYDATRKSE